MHTSMDILILSLDIKRGGSPDCNLNFYDQMVRVEKGWVEHEFVLLIIYCIAKWNKVAKCVNILQDSTPEKDSWKWQLFQIFIFIKLLKHLITVINEKM